MIWSHIGNRNPFVRRTEMTRPTKPGEPGGVSPRTRKYRALFCRGHWSGGLRPAVRLCRTFVESVLINRRKG